MTNTINIRFPLRKSSQGAFEGNVETIDAIRDDLRILLLTNYGERPILYEFGANLRKSLFNEPGANIKQKIKDQIVSAINRWMPFVNIGEIFVLDMNDDYTIENNKIRIKIHFFVGELDGVLEQSI